MKFDETPEPINKVRDEPKTPNDKSTLDQSSTLDQTQKAPLMKQKTSPKEEEKLAEITEQRAKTPKETRNVLDIVHEQEDESAFNSSKKPLNSDASITKMHKTIEQPQEDKSMNVEEDHQQQSGTSLPPIVLGKKTEMIIDE